MKPSTKRQIKNGLRIGGGIGAFWIAAMLVGVTLDGLQDAPGHLRLWPDGAIAGGLLALAAAILVLTARIWIIYIAGCLLFAIPKVIAVIVSGKDFYSPHGPFSRLEAAELLVFCLASLFLIYRISANHAPTPFDRFAFTLYLASFVLAASGDFSPLATWQIVGLAALFVAWYLSRKKHRRHHIHATRMVE
ncbi:MAG: hypothetical protein ABSA78_03880 [Candidatus Sulfotelmatobacter sp.]|jgi:hypothetical protein